MTLSGDCTDEFRHNSVVLLGGAVTGESVFNHAIACFVDYGNLQLQQRARKFVLRIDIYVYQIIGNRSNRAQIQDPFLVAGVSRVPGALL